VILTAAVCAAPRDEQTAGAGLSRLRILVCTCLSREEAADATLRSHVHRSEASISGYFLAGGHAGDARPRCQALCACPRSLSVCNSYKRWAATTHCPWALLALAFRARSQRLPMEDARSDSKARLNLSDRLSRLPPSWSKRILRLQKTQFFGVPNCAALEGALAEEWRLSCARSI